MPSNPKRSWFRPLSPSGGHDPDVELVLKRAAECRAMAKNHRADATAHSYLAWLAQQEAGYAKTADALADQYERIARRLEEGQRDSERLDQLEMMGNEPGGLLLHRGDETGRCGLGLKGIGRTLRKAVDDALRATSGETTP